MENVTGEQGLNLSGNLFHTNLKFLVFNPEIVYIKQSIGKGD